MAALLSVLLAILPGFIIYFALKHFDISIFKEKSAGRLPDGSMGWPFIGETLAFLKPHKSNSIGSFLQDNCARYGRVFKSHLFGCPTIVSCDHELNMFVLQNEEKLFQSSYPKPVHDVLGKLSMMLVSGEFHKKIRSVAVGFINSSCKSRSGNNFLGYLEKLSLSFIDSWKSKEEVLFFKEAKELTFHLMLKSLMNIEPEDPLAAIVLGDFLTFMKGFVSLPLYIPGTAYAKAVKAILISSMSLSGARESKEEAYAHLNCQKLRRLSKNARTRISSTLQEMIMKRREKNNIVNEEGDFLDELLLGKVWLSDEERVSLLLDLLLAGYETTSGLMALVVYFLSQAPQALQTLQEEHQVLRGRKKEGEFLNWEDYKQMEFTSYVICEALRCGNLVKFLHRKALQDVKFKEYVIPRGWQVLPIFSGAHLDPSLHENPFHYNPWRWDDPATSRKVSPFGGGLRTCPGAELGKLETAFFLHHFVLNIRWKLKEEDCPVSCPYMDFKRGLPMKIESI